MFLLDALRDKNDTHVTAEVCSAYSLFCVYRSFLLQAKMLSGDFKGSSSGFDPNNCCYIAEVISVLLKV